MTCSAHLVHEELLSLLSIICNTFFLRVSAELAGQFPTYTFGRMRPSSMTYWLDVLFLIVQGDFMDKAIRTALRDFRLEVLPTPNLKDAIYVVPALEDFGEFVEKVCECVESPVPSTRQRSPAPCQRSPALASTLPAPCQHLGTPPWYAHDYCRRV